MIYDYVCVGCRFLYQDGLGNCYCSNPDSPTYGQIIMSDEKSMNIAHCDFANESNEGIKENTLTR